MSLGTKPTKPTTGIDGRTSPPPEGDLWVRDPDAARANAIRAMVARYKAAGIPIPDHLQSLADDLTDKQGPEEIVLVNAGTGKPMNGQAPKPKTPTKAAAEPLVVEEVSIPEPEPVPGPTGTVVDGIEPALVAELITPEPLPEPVAPKPEPTPEPVVVAPEPKPEVVVKPEPVVAAPAVAAPVKPEPTPTPAPAPEPKLESSTTPPAKKAAGSAQQRKK